MTALADSVADHNSVSHGRGRIHFFTPSFRPVGGVVKILDYAAHAADLGFSVEIRSPSPYRRGERIFVNSRFAQIAERENVGFGEGFDTAIRPEDFIFFSLPGSYPQIARRAARGFTHDHVIHLVQGTRHANPTWEGGLAVRLLGRPMTRIMVGTEVLNATEPFLNRSSRTRVITEGYDWPFFHEHRDGRLSSPLNVAYTTWKSDAGSDVEAALSHDRRFTFRSIGHEASWSELRALYVWADVFLCTPGPEEGFYLPGLEAMAAGAIVVAPDVGGNRAYAQFGANAIEVRFGDVASYTDALHGLLRASEGQIAAMRAAGYDVLERHNLERERAEFADLMATIESGCDREGGC